MSLEFTKQLKLDVKDIWDKLTENSDAYKEMQELFLQYLEPKDLVEIENLLSDETIKELRKILTK